MRSLRPLLVLGVLAALATATVARANDAAVRATVQKEARLLHQSREVMAAIRAATVSPHSTPKVLHALRSLELALAGAAGAVSRTHASTAKGRRGRRDWIVATRALALGYGEFANALSSLAHRQTARAERQATRAALAIRVAEADGARADRELGLR